MSLYKKIKNKNAHIGVVGLGYVGLPLAVEFAKAGYNVSGIEVDDNKITAINNGNNYIPDIDNSLLENLVKQDKLVATNDTSIISKLDAISICVPTPLSKVNEPDVSYIIDSVNAIKKYLHKDFLITLESTTYPGTTKEVILSKMEETGLIAGEDYYLCFSPERIDPGNETYNISNTPKIIGGVTNECTKVGQFLYSQIVKDVITVSSPETAEMVKLLENTFRSINIGLANEVAIMCEKLGIDVWEVINAAATKPYGFMKFINKISQNPLGIIFFITTIFSHSVTYLVFWEKIYFNPEKIWKLPYEINFQKSIFEPITLISSLIFLTVLFVIIGIKLKSRYAHIKEN